MGKEKVYEGVVGLIIDVPLYDVEGEEVSTLVISAQNLRVLRPGETEEEVWVATAVAPNILRHIVPQAANLLPGKYKIQPYIETVDGYKGRGQTVEVEILKNWK